MKSFFNEEVEGYTSPKNIRTWVLGGAVFAGAVFVGWLLNVAPKIVTFMDVFTDAI